MPNGAMSSPGGYPSRRSLRTPQFPSRRALREPATFPSRRSLRESSSIPHPAPADVSDSRTKTSETATQAPPAYSAPLPLPFPFVPASALPVELTSAEPHPTPHAPKRAVTVRRVFTGAAALVSAGGLFVAMAVPGFSIVTGEPPASALPHQELAGTIAGVGADSPLSALGSVSAEPTGDPVDFINFKNADVQYPFATGQQLTDGFGPRSYPVAGMHAAQDFAAPEGTPVQAIARGVVLETGWSDDGCGFGVLLQHTIDGDDVTSRYCHMQFGSNSLEVGQTIEVADHVGSVGATGLAFGAHLHFALTVNDELVDPMPFLLEKNRSTRR